MDQTAAEVRVPHISSNKSGRLHTYFNPVNKEDGTEWLYIIIYLCSCLTDCLPVAALAAVGRGGGVPCAGGT